MQSTRGKLKVFLGYAPSVGKTYAMLDAAQRRRAEGVDVVVACVETHHMPETERLLQGLEIVGEPCGLELDAVLARHPHLVVVDDLASLNLPGARHPRRSQDVEELLDAGIDVLTTLDIQQLESLRETIQAITGRSPHTTIPDRVFDSAAIIEVIDLPPDELLQRIRQRVKLGQIDPSEAEAYQSIEQVTALREIALRRAAGRLDTRQAAPFSLAHPEMPDRILVCVSSHPLSERLVRTGRRLADDWGLPWSVLYVHTPERGSFILPHHQQLENTLHLAEELGASVFRVSALDLSEAIADFTRQHNVTRLILGNPRHARWRDWLGGSLVDQVIRKVGTVDVIIINDARQPIATYRPTGGPGWRTGYSYLQAVGITAVVSAISYPLHFVIDPSNVVMFYLAAVVGTAFFLGRGPAILSSVLSVLTFDFFMVEPRFSFSVADTQYLITFLGFFVISLLISSLVGQIRSQVDASSLRERQTAALYALSRDLAAALDLQTIIQMVEKHIRQTFVRAAHIWLKDENRLVAAGQPLSAEEQEIANWVLEHRRPAGKGSDTFPHGTSAFYPLIAGNALVGVLQVLEDESSQLMGSEKRELLDAYCSIAALAVERTRLAEQTNQVRLAHETERLQTALLNSISHDLRTPLATVTGVFSSLQESESPDSGSAPLDPATRLELINTGWEEAERLNRIVGNLLDMIRLEAGALRLNLQDGDVEEVIGSVLARMKKYLVSNPIRTQVAPGLPLVKMDAILIEQVLVNILENASKFSPPNGEISIRAVETAAEVLVSVRDQGMGFPAEDMPRIFDKFYRAKTARSVLGSGLGLSICKGIIEAHHGHIWAENLPAGGSQISFALPVSPIPAASGETV